MVSYKNIPITKEAWNGIIENKCIICDTEFDSLESHITSQEHLFQLVQVDVEFGAYNGLYRVVSILFQIVKWSFLYFNFLYCLVLLIYFYSIILDVTVEAAINTI